MTVLSALWEALALAFSMTWKITWALILGFTLSAAVQAVVRRQAVTRLIGDDSPKSLLTAAGLGAASSSCSYAAVALARSLFRKGANFTAAMAFQIASTRAPGSARRATTRVVLVPPRFGRTLGDRSAAHRQVSRATICRGEPASHSRVGTTVPERSECCVVRPVGAARCATSPRTPFHRLPGCPR